MRKNPRRKSLKDVEMQRLRRAWQKAREGEQESKVMLLKLLAAHKSVDAFVRYWSELKATPSPKKSEDELLDDLVLESLRQKSPRNSWSRGAEAFISGTSRPVSGGLPSLGKRSK